jgi:hypothetical protein
MSWIKSRATSAASAVVFVAEKCAIFVNRSTVTRMASLPAGDGGSATTKSIEIECHG